MFCYFLFFRVCVCVVEHTQHTEREQEEALEISGRRHTQYQAQTFTITFCRGATTTEQGCRFHMAAVYGTDCRHPASGWSGTSALHGIWHESDEKADSTLRLSQRQRVGCCSADVSISIPLVSRTSSLSGGGTITTTGRTRKRKSERATERAALAQCFLRRETFGQRVQSPQFHPHFAAGEFSHIVPLSLGELVDFLGRLSGASRSKSI